MPRTASFSDSTSRTRRKFFNLLHVGLTVICSSIRVPFPGLLCKEKVPPTFFMRASIFFRPLPRLELLAKVLPRNESVRAAARLTAARFTWPAFRKGLRQSLQG